jgi:hypothetical protein
MSAEDRPEQGQNLDALWGAEAIGKYLGLKTEG